MGAPAMDFFLLVMSKGILICYLQLHTFPQSFMLFPPKYTLFLCHLSWLMISPNTGFYRLPVLLLLLLLLFLIVIDLKCQKLSSGPRAA